MTITIWLQLSVCDAKEVVESKWKIIMIAQCRRPRRRGRAQHSTSTDTVDNTGGNEGKCGDVLAFAIRFVVRYFVDYYYMSNHATHHRNCSRSLLGLPSKFDLYVYSLPAVKASAYH